jgi:hypothetical protein
MGMICVIESSGLYYTFYVQVADLNQATDVIRVHLIWTFILFIIHLITTSLHRRGGPIIIKWSGEWNAREKYRRTAQAYLIRLLVLFHGTLWSRLLTFYKLEWENDVKDELERMCVEIKEIITLDTVPAFFWKEWGKLNDLPRQVTSRPRPHEYDWMPTYQHRR